MRNGAGVAGPKMNKNSAAILIFNWEEKSIPARKKTRGRVYFAQHNGKHLLVLSRQMVESCVLFCPHQWDGKDGYRDCRRWRLMGNEGRGF